MRKSAPGTALLMIVLFTMAAARLYAQESGWTGFYIGINAGRAWKKEATSLSISNNAPNNYFNSGAVAGVNASGSTRLDDDGFSGGIQAGYNHQAGRAVVGIESDFNYLGSYQFKAGTFPYTTSATTYSIVTSEQSPWVFFARPRVGVSIAQVLLYGTGGLALVHSRFQQDFSEGAFTPTPEQLVDRRTQTGWCVGGGFEVMFGRRLSGKGEYVISRFGETTGIGQLSGGNGASPSTGFVDGATFTNSISALKLHSVRLGLNFHF